MGEGHAAWMQELVSVAVSHYGSLGRLCGRPPVCVPEAEVEASVLLYPGKVCAGGGRLVVSDTGHHRLLVLGAEGGVLEVVGSGQAGWRDGGVDTAMFSSPQGVCVLGGSLYVADTGNHCVRKVDLSSRTVTTVAGTGVQGEDKEGGRRGLEQELASPWDLCPVEDPEGGQGLLIAMAGLHQLWLHALTPLCWWKGACYTAGTTVRVAGSGAEENRNNSYPARAGFAQPSGVAADGAWIYVADSESSTVRRVDRKDGAVKGLCGGEIDPTNLFAYGDTDGEGRTAKLQHPLGVALARDGATLYVADSYNHKVKQVVLSGAKARVSTLAGGLSEPGGLCLSEDGARLYVADTNSHCVRVVEVGSGAVSRLEVVMGGGGEEKGEVVRRSSHRVGGGEGVLDIRASVLEVEGVRLNKEAASTYSLTVDQVSSSLKSASP